jgi:hypothetical protein
MTSPVIASAAKQSILPRKKLDYFVASLLAMTKTNTVQFVSI